MFLFFLDDTSCFELHSDGFGVTRKPFGWTGITKGIMTTHGMGCLLMEMSVTNVMT